jgi:hypothetical protein
MAVLLLLSNAWCAGAPPVPGPPIEPGPFPERPADAGITVTPGLTIALGASHSHTFTVSANGPGVSQAVSVRITLPGYPDIGYQSVSIAGVSGAGEASSLCDTVLGGPNTDYCVAMMRHFECCLIFDLKFDLTSTLLCLPCTCRRHGM